MSFNLGHYVFLLNSCAPATIGNKRLEYKVIFCVGEDVDREQQVGELHGYATRVNELNSGNAGNDQ